MMTDKRADEKNDDDLSLSEKIGAIIFLVGLVLTAILWWQGMRFWDALWAGLFFTLAGGLLVLVSNGFRTGELEIRGGSVNREESPITFWIFAIFYVIVAIGLTGFMVFALL